MMNMGSDGGKARVKSLRTAAAEFPRVFLDLLNAKHIAFDAFDQYFMDFSFGTRPPSTPATPRKASAVSARPESEAERILRLMGFIIAPPAAPQAKTDKPSLLRRSEPPVYHHFSDEEIEEQKVLRDAVQGLISTWWHIESAEGTRHLCVLPVLACYLRHLAGLLMRGDSIDDDVAEFWGEFQRRQRHILRDNKDKSASTDDVFTLSACYIAQKILKKFAEIPPASLALLHRCKDPECRCYFLRKSIRPPRFHSKHCADRHAYRLRQK
jgi:hypothetical protein